MFPDCDWRSHSASRSLTNGHNDATTLPAVHRPLGSSLLSPEPLLTTSTDEILPNLTTARMKLIITGASGLVATELLRQSLRMREITKVVALARKPVSAPADVSPADAAKLQSVVLDDYERYPDDVRSQLAGADACIWSVPSSFHCPGLSWWPALTDCVGPWPSRPPRPSRTRSTR